MKKLRTKLFVTIFLIITIFTTFIFLFSNLRAYTQEKNNIANVIDKLYKEDPSTNLDQKKIFMEYNIYTIILGENNTYKAIISNTLEDMNSKKIEKLANNIIKKKNQKQYIGNLYFNQYSYKFINDEILIIIDNSKTTKKVTEALVVTSITFVLLEISTVIVAYTLTKWLITPVETSFEKQKTFIADASHELKTPLTVIDASCDAYFNDKNDKWIKNIKNETTRMTKLVTELLDLATLENNDKVPIQEENLSNIIESSVLTFESLFYEKNIKLKYNIKKDIMLDCNQDLIKELMSILIDNAISHTKEKNKVEITLTSTNKEINLKVKNEGSKINKEDETKIFERFYRADKSRNRQNNKYGLGLSIAKNIVEKQKGNIKAYSKDNYTIFEITWNQNKWFLFKFLLSLKK